MRVTYRNKQPLREFLQASLATLDVTDEANFGRPGVIGAAGHRARLRERLLRTGPDSLADHEVLEMVLFLALPRRNAKPIARALVTRFGSYSPALTAPMSDLRSIEGLGESGAAALKIAQAATSARPLPK